MMVKSISICNAKSFRDETTVSFDDKFNILVGPNAGGKSNLLDILTVIVRHYFLKGYYVRSSDDEAGPFESIEQTPLFQPITRYLEKHIGHESLPQTVKIELAIGAVDVDNMQAMKNNKSELEEVLSRYRSRPLANLDMVDSWKMDELPPGRTLSYEIVDYRLQPPGSIESMFLQYTSYLELCLILARQAPDIRLAPCYVYFSPYRTVSQRDLEANLAGDNYYELLARYFGATSKSATALVKIASLVFAEMRRGYESSADASGYGQRWGNDRKVQKVASYLRNVGYSWELRLLDARRNVYEVVISKDGRSTLLGQASSGEKEIISFILGIFALDVRGGLVVIDEPELHLHPRWQAVLRDLLADLANTTGNQFILSTHSPVFITPSTVGNVRRVFNTPGQGTRVASLPVQSPGRTEEKDLLHIVNTHNNERMFFADRTVLVEGIKDRLVFEKLLDACRSAAGQTDVIEVLEVHGKDNFGKYQEFLTRMGVQTAVVADLDYVLTLGGAELRSLFEPDRHKIYKKVICDKKSKDGATLVSLIDESVRTEDLNALRGIWDHIKNRHMRLREDLSDEERALLDGFVKTKQTEGVYILKRGEIEDYLPKAKRELDGVVELVKEENFRCWLRANKDEPAVRELRDIVLRILGIPDQEGSELWDRVCSGSP